MKVIGEDGLEVGVSREVSIGYLVERLISIDREQADRFFPERIKGVCIWCGRECFGLRGREPNTCSYCARESKIHRVSSKERLEHNEEAIKWMNTRKAEWIPRESTKQTPLRGESFSNRVLEILPGKMAEHRNKAWG